MRLILRYLKKYKLWVLLNSILVFGFALVELGVPTITADVIDYGIALSNKSYIITSGIKMIIISLIGVVATIMLGFCTSKISTSVTHDIRLDLYKKIQKFSSEEYNKFKIAGLITRVNNDAFQIQMFINTFIKMVFLTPVMFLGSLVLTFKSSPQLFWVIFATVPFIVIGVAYVIKITGPISEKQQKGLDDLNMISRENLTGIRVIRAFNRQDNEKKIFSEKNEEFAGNSKRLFKIMLYTQPIFFMLMNFAVCLIFYFGALLISNGNLEVGKMVAFLDYLFHAMISIIFFCTIFINYPKANVSAKRIQSVFDSDLSLVNEPKEDLHYTTNNKIEFKNVSYIKEGKNILKDISFEASTGETIAIVGSTGSGKSTLVRLLARMFDATSGSIKINNQDIKDLDVNQWRAKIGFIPQKAFLFKGSIRDNILFGKNDATEEEVIEAAEFAQAKEFISLKANGFDEIVEEGASNLSGGQKQRLSIARAIIRKPDIYIFDDAFSALDFKTDAKLRNGLKPVFKNAITFIVAQRISTIMDADKIIVLDHGKIDAIGNHDELMGKCELYRSIANSQIGEEEIKYEEEI